MSLLLPARLTDLIRRDLGANRVELVHPAGDPADEDVAAELAESLTAELPRGYTLLVELTDPDADRAAMQRRLDTIVSSFWDSLTEALPAAARPQVSDALQSELRALVEAAGATNAVVIDAMSTVTWAEADASEAAPHDEKQLAEVIPFDRAAREDAPVSSPVVLSPTELAVESVRALPSMATLAKGALLAHHEREAAVPYVARSLATIYVLVLVFDAPFDELRAEREIQARLGGIERLVIALPPLDPTPHAGAKAMRARRR